MSPAARMLSATVLLLIFVVAAITIYGSGQRGASALNNSNITAAQADLAPVMSTGMTLLQGQILLALLGVGTFLILLVVRKRW